MANDRPTMAKRNDRARKLRDRVKEAIATAAAGRW